MQTTDKKNSSASRWLVKIALIVYDIVFVNLAYYLALVIRFYVNHEFHSSVQVFIPLFVKFIPYYSICCVVVFWLFKLYDGMWKYAGWNDINRIVGASIVTCAIHIAGTLLFIQRMPLTYYFFGALIQFVFIVASRFAYRILMIEFSKYVKDRNAVYIPVMIVGAGENARAVLRHFEEGGQSLARPVCVIDFHNQNAGRLFDGLPIVGGLDDISKAAEKFKVKCVVLADSLMPEEVRAKVSEICKENEIEVQDFYPFAQNVGKKISFRSLLECANGAVIVVSNGASKRFDNSEQAASAFYGKYFVKSVAAKGSVLQIEIENDYTVLNNTNEAWVRDYESETGESVSFF